MSWNLSLQLNNLWEAVRAIQSSFTLGLASNLRINTASSTTTYGILDCASISANHTSGTLVLTNYAGLTGLTLDSVGNINIPTNLTLGYLNSTKTLVIGSITAYTSPPSPANTLSIGLTTPVAFYVYAGMYVTVSSTSNPVFNGRYKILNILSASAISVGNPTGITQGTTSLGGNLDFGYVGAVDVVASGTITANQVITATQTNSASASVTLTNASPQYQLNTYGGGATTYTLPDATTLPVGTVFQFNNNSGGTNLLIRNFASTLLYTATNGSIVEAINLTNSTGAGTWDLHAFAPSNAVWGSGALTYNGNVTLTGTHDVTVSATGKVNTPLIKNGTSDITLGNAQNTAGGFVNIGVMNNASNSYPNVGKDSNNLSIGWNQSGGDAEIDFYNSANTGFNFYGRNTSTSIFQVARMRGDNIASYSFSIGAGAYAYSGAGSYGTSVGVNVGNASMTGGSNTLLGYASGNALTDGYYNTCLGGNAGSGLTTGAINTLIGLGAGGRMANGAGNVAVGVSALGGTTNSGNNNTAIGRDVLTANNMSGSQNIGIGFNTGRVTSGNNNTLMGQACAISLTTGGGNICIGYDVGNAGTVLTTGNNNTYIGYGANSLNVTNTGEVVLGQARGNGNSSVTLGCNDNLLYLSGWTIASTQLAVTAGGQVYRFSDSRAKTDISYIPKGGHIETLMKLKPAEFKLKIDTIKEKYVGFIAQDLMEVIPNCVDGKKYEYEWEMDLDRNPIRDEDGNVKLRKDENGELIPRYKGLDWNEINTRAILAIQEQQDEIVSLKAQLASLKATVDALVASTGHLVV